MTGYTRPRRIGPPVASCNSFSPESEGANRHNLKLITVFTQTIILWSWQQVLKPRDLKNCIGVNWHFKAKFAWHWNSHKLYLYLPHTADPLAYLSTFWALGVKGHGVFAYLYIRQSIQWTLAHFTAIKTLTKSRPYSPTTTRPIEYFALTSKSSRWI